MTPQERIEAARKRKEAAEALLTDDVKKAIEDREAAERAEAEAAELEAKIRKHALAIALEDAKSKYGEHLRDIDLEDREPGHGVWIVKPADSSVMKQFHKDAKQPNADSDAMNRRVAEACVVYWGRYETDKAGTRRYVSTGADAEDGEAMHGLWDTFGAIPTTLGNAAVELGGFVAETRKSVR